jgi:hypothetical protein
VAKVRVYKWTKYNPTTDENVITSRRMATRGTVARMGGAVIEDTGTEIDEVQLDGDGEGWTPVDFRP